MRVDQFVNHLRSYGWKRGFGKTPSETYKGIWTKTTDPELGNVCTLTCEIRKHRGKWLADCKYEAPRMSSLFAYQISELIFMNGWNRYNRSQNFIGKLEYTGFFEEK